MGADVNWLSTCQFLSPAICGPLINLCVRPARNQSDYCYDPFRIANTTLDRGRRNPSTTASNAPGEYRCRREVIAADAADAAAYAFAEATSEVASGLSLAECGASGGSASARRSGSRHRIV